MHKPAYKTFQTRLVIFYAIDELWQFDLVDLSKLSRENDAHKFILSIIHVLSKYGWLLPLKSKHGSEIKGALTKLFEQTKRNFHVQEFLKMFKIKFLQHSQSDRQL